MSILNKDFLAFISPHSSSTLIITRVTWNACTGVLKATLNILHDLHLLSIATPTWERYADSHITVKPRAITEVKKRRA